MTSFAMGAQAYDAQVDIAGEVITESCKINGSSVLPASIDVPLSAINTNALSQVGSWAQNTRFVVSLTDCPSTVNVAWTQFSNVDVETGALINTLATGTSAQIRVLDSKFQPIDMNNDPGVSVTTGAADLTYYGQYYAKQVPVRPGKLSTYGYISLTY